MQHSKIDLASQRRRRTVSWMNSFVRVHLEYRTRFPRCRWNPRNRGDLQFQPRGTPREIDSLFIFNFARRLEIVFQTRRRALCHFARLWESSRGNSSRSEKITAESSFCDDYTEVGENFENFSKTDPLISSLGKVKFYHLIVYTTTEEFK